MPVASHALAERTVPRYTSYPTAPHFNAEVGPHTYADWLGQLPSAATLSLYLHVPFCVELCHYCGCHTRAVRRRDPIARYAEILAQEVALVAGLAGGRRVLHLHWGGGTPSTLGEETLVALTERLRRAFDLGDIREHAIELDPRHVTPSLARALAECGINRASFGVQDFSPHVQEAIGRIQPFDVVRRAVDAVREAGIARINLDLMYGLPHQTRADVERTATLAAGLGPDRLALFGYAHVPWFKTHQRLINEAALPGPAERVHQLATARDTLLAAGYAQVGLDHFAREDDALAVAARSGALQRNFQGYTDDRADALIGLGASSIGRLPQGCVQNAPDVGGYARALGEGRLATVKGIALSDADRQRAHIIERLMCDLKVDLSSADDFEAEMRALGPLVAEGLVACEGPRIEVTEPGRPFVRLVAAAFDTYLQAGRARHSVAV